MNTLTIGPFLGVREAQTFDVYGPATHRHYTVTVYDREAMKEGAPPFVDVTYNDSPIQHPDMVVYRNFATLDEAGAYIEKLEGDAR